MIEVMMVITAAVVVYRLRRRDRRRHTPGRDGGGGAAAGGACRRSCRRRPQSSSLSWLVIVSLPSLRILVCRRLSASGAIHRRLSSSGVVWRRCPYTATAGLIDIFQSRRHVERVGFGACKIVTLSRKSVSVKYSSASILEVCFGPRIVERVCFGKLRR